MSMETANKDRPVFRRLLRSTGAVLLGLLAVIVLSMVGKTYRLTKDMKDAAVALGLPLAPFVAAALSGGIFGDHSSPISDTTIIASLAAAVDHIDHVRTQLPYAMTAAGLATVAFALAGFYIG
jgi:hypothetical protein